VTRLLAGLALIAIAWLVGAAVLMNVIGVVHAWWRFVPTMPYTVALQVTFLYVVAAVFSGIMKALVGAES
jgi:hypothetical protein